MYAASTPRLTRVSMVVVPCRAAWNAALWNGQAAQRTTGVESMAIAHSMVIECIIVMAITTTGTARTADTIRRRSRVGSLWSCSPCSVCSLAW